MLPINSLIITGIVQSIEDCGDKDKVTALITYRRDYKDLSNHVAVEEINFRIELDGRRAAFFKARAATGVEVRVVGRLKQTGPEVLVYAEHVEYGKRVL